MHHTLVGFILVMQDWFSIKKSINVIHQKNRVKRKKYKITLIDAEYTFEKSAPIRE